LFLSNLTSLRKKGGKVCWLLQRTQIIREEDRRKRGERGIMFSSAFRRPIQHMHREITTKKEEEEREPCSIALQDEKDHHASKDWYGEKEGGEKKGNLQACLRLFGGEKKIRTS